MTDRSMKYRRFAEYTLTPGERIKLEQALREVPDANASPSAAMRFLQRHFARVCAGAVITHLFDMRTNATGPGALLVHNGPACPLPPTPLNGDSRGTHLAFTSHGYLMGAMMQLGHPISHIAQKSGALIADVVPVPGCEQSISNAGFAQVLDLHVEDVHLDRSQRPTFVGLLCLRPDPDDRAETLIVDTRDIVHRLDRRTVAELRQPNFAIPPSESFTGGSQSLQPIAVLSGPDDLPEVAVEFNTTRTLTAAAEAALAAFKQAARYESVAVKLGAGDLLIVCNRRTLHGRGIFAPRFEHGRDNRWLLRLSVIADPYLVRDVVAPGGVRILEVGAADLRERVTEAARQSGVRLPADAMTMASARACVSRYDAWLSEMGASTRPLVERLRTEFAVFAAHDIVCGRLLAADAVGADQSIALAIALVCGDDGGHEAPARSGLPPLEINLAALKTALQSGDRGVQALMARAVGTAAPVV